MRREVGASCKKWGQRPEDTDGGGSAHYQEDEAARYTSVGQATQIQKDLTMRAVDLLCLSVRPWFVNTEGIQILRST